MKKLTGFTQLEVVMTLAIIMAMLVLGGPSLQKFLQGNQLIATTNELVSALHIARSEAIKLNTRVSICESSNGTSCSNTGSWKNGWIVFVDFDGNLVNSGSPCTALNTDCLLRVHDAINDPLLSVSGVDSNTNAVSSFTFTARGMPKDVSGVSESGVFSICSFDSSNNVIGSREVVLSLSGRVRVRTSDTAVIICPTP